MNERHLILIKDYIKEINEIENTGKKGFSANVFPLKNGNILVIPGEQGEERYPYGEGGYNFWVYASGYMHANDGLFSTFLRPTPGEDPKCAFFADVEGEVISLLHVPVLSGADNIKRYTVFAEKEAFFITLFKGMIFAVVVSVSGDNDMTFDMYAVNKGKDKVNVKLSSYFNPYLRNSIYESSEDKWFRRAMVTDNASSSLKSFVFIINEDLSRTESVSNFGVINRCFCLGEGSLYKGEKLTTSMSKYKGGINHSLMNIRDSLNSFMEQEVCAFTETAVAADLVSYEIGGASFVNLTEQLRYTVGEKEETAYEKLLSMKECHNVSEESCDISIDFKSDTEDPKEGSLDADIMTSFAGHLIKQVEFCSMIKGYVQLSPNSLIGIRDVFQALEGYIYINPRAAKEKMLEALGFIGPDGRCPRQYAIPSHEGMAPNMDLREFIDQGCWVIDCIMSYIKLTGDYGFLHKECGYYEIVDEGARLTRKSEKTDSVLMHMIRITDYLIDKQDPDTGCIRAMYGDWNDALDGLGVSKDPGVKFGNGISVMASLQVYKNLRDMVKLLYDSGEYTEKIKRYEKAADDLKEGLIKNAVIKDEKGNARIVHGWGQDRSYYVGSFSDPDGLSRHGLTSNAFWVLSGIEKEASMKDVILSSYDALDSQYGFKTFEPAFGRDVRGVGRIYKLPAGTAENGASYIHATTFAIMSLFMLGESEKAWEEIRKILPFTHANLSCSPYVMPNSYGFNPDLNIDGESMQDWQTGSSNVIFKTLVRFVFGFMPDFDSLTICPGVFAPFEVMTADFIYRGKKIRICIRKAEDERRFILNGKAIDSVFDKAMNLRKAELSVNMLKDENVLEVIG